MKSKIIAQAKKVFRDYKLMERFVAGIVLTGNEIKSLRNHQVSINEAYILPQKQELYVINMPIAVYKYSNPTDLTKTHDPQRKRKILLKRKEINKLLRVLKAKNYVLVPLQLFITDKGWAKLEIALAQRLRKYQVKEKIKEKEMKRELRKEVF
jgi:SsrA-binding protein